jgi:hypothetical protein
MRKTVRGRGNGNDRTQNDSRESKWALRGGWNEKDCAGRREWEWQNMEWQPTPYCLNK